jgi:hypothetical protein
MPYYDDSPADLFYEDVTPTYEELHPVYRDDYNNTDPLPSPKPALYPRQASTYVLSPQNVLPPTTTCSPLASPTATSHPTSSEDFTDIFQFVYGKQIRYEEFSDDELAKTVRQLESIRSIGDVIECRKARRDKIGQLLEYIETIRNWRIERDTKVDLESARDESEVEDEKEDQEDEGDVYPLTPPLLVQNVTIVVTPPPDILAPIPLPLSPNIFTLLSQSHSHSPNEHAPDIVAPQPPPPKPNIPPDILPPQPLPLKPNIPVYRPSPACSF